MLHKQHQQKKQKQQPAALRSHALHSRCIGINFFAVEFFLPAHVARQKHRPRNKFQNSVPVAGGSSERIIPRKSALAAGAQAYRAPRYDVPCLRVTVTKVRLENNTPAELQPLSINKN